MTWDSRTGSFRPGGAAGVSLPGQTGNMAGSKTVTVQDLINLGLIDPGVTSAGGTLFSGATTRFAASVAAALADSAASIELNSATLFKKMNGLAGMVIGSGGLAGYDSTGAATITIDPATGSVTLSGTITATAGAIGGFTLGATTLTATSGGNTTIVSSGATAFSAGPTGSPTVTITQAGVLTATSGTFSGSITGASGTFSGNISTTGYVKATGGEPLSGLNSAVIGSQTVDGYLGVFGYNIGNGFGVYGWSTHALGVGVFATNSGGGLALQSGKAKFGGTIESIVGTGTAPFIIASTTRVSNLNVATAGTADVLTTARTIGGVSFDGSANINPLLATIDTNAVVFQGTATGSTISGYIFLNTAGGAGQVRVATYNA